MYETGTADNAAAVGGGAVEGLGRAHRSRRRRRIFVSYRRDDTSGYAGRIYEELADRFGPSRVFRDIETIDIGSDFTEAIDAGLESCRVLLVIIGKEWLMSADASGHTRLDDPTDVLRLEVAHALERDIVVVPVLVEGATMPSATSLPEPLQALTRRNALEISDTRWDHDIARLEAVLEKVVGHGRRLTTRRLVAGLSLLVVLGTAVGVRVGGNPFLPRSAALGPMVGDFNIAVSSFPELRPDGRVVPSAAGDALASTLFGQLDDELRPFKDAGFVIGRRSPDDTSVVEGATREERAMAAGRLASRVNADIVVYGVLQTAAAQTAFTPEFYLSERTLTKAEELGGQHELGMPVGTNGPLSNPVVTKLIRDRLLGRIDAMTQLAIGLGYYAIDGHYQEALDHFEAARAAPGWDDADGKEVLYLFLGNAAQKVGDLARAEAAFQQAVVINPEYARGRLGVAEAMFQRAKGSCEAGQANADGLAHAATAFRAAREAKDQPATSNVPLKADLALGRVYVCQSQALLTDRWQDAAELFGRVIAAFEAGNQHVRQLAAEAYAGVAFVDLPFADAPDARDRLERSASAYEKAIAVSVEADRSAAFYAMLGYVRGQLGEPADADAAFAEAIRLEPDPDVRHRYETARSEGPRTS